MIDCELYADNNHSYKVIARKLYDICPINRSLIFVFVGTDANIGDSLGPICGQITDFSNRNCLFYGDLTIR